MTHQPNTAVSRIEAAVDSYINEYRALLRDLIADVLSEPEFVAAVAALVPSTAATAAQEQAVAATDWAKVEAAVESYIDDYEMRGEDEAGRDACYTPNDNDRALLRDCIAGLLSEPEFIAALSAIAARERASAAAVRTLQRIGYTYRGGVDWAPPLGHEPEFKLLDSKNARIAELEAACEVSGKCSHRIADARNPLVKSGYICIDCGALFSAADHGQEAPAAESPAPDCTTCNDNGMIGGPILDAANKGELAFYEYAVAAHCKATLDILDGKDDGSGTNNEPWATVRKRLLELVATRGAHAALVPDGWKLVPMEPTEEMGVAYLDAAKLHAAEGAEDTMRFSWGGYRAMLAAAPPPPVPAQKPVLCVSSKKFQRMRAGDDHIKAWLPPATDAEDMLLYTHPAPQQAGGGDIAVRAALRQIIEADDRQALTQQLIDVGRAALEAEEASKLPMSAQQIAEVATATKSAEPGRDGWVLPTAFTRAIEAHHGIGSAGGINTRAQEGKQRD